MTQKDMASVLGQHHATIQLWERGVGNPGVKCLPRIIRFLGYVPIQVTRTEAGQFAFLRNCCGMTQEEASRLVGCDSCTIGRWESGLTENSRRFGNAMNQLWSELERAGIAALLDHAPLTRR